MTRWLQACRWLVFPVFGILLAWMFRNPEQDLVSLTERSPVRPLPRTLSLPGGHSLRFIGIPDPAGGIAFYLGETEIPDAVWRSFSDRPPSHAAAKTFAATLSEQTGTSLRLPTATEWRQAARGGVANAEVPWGFGPGIPDRVRFAMESPPSRPGPAFGYGFRDLAGGCWEWTAEGLLLGGAWSERNSEELRIDNAWSPPPGYADLDTGIRLVWVPTP